MTNDIEKRLKDLLAQAEAEHGIDCVSLYPADIQEILDRFKEYRDRFAKNARKADLRHSQMKSDYDYIKSLMDMGRRRISPGGGYGPSQSENAEAAAIIERLEKLRGRIIAQRMFWGQAASPDTATETVGVLTAAVAAAKAEEAKWRKYLTDERAKKQAIKTADGSAKEGMKPQTSLVNRVLNLFRGRN